MEEVAEEEEGAFDRYSRMSRHQKLALLMISLGPQASAIEGRRVIRARRSRSLKERSNKET